MAAVNYTSDDLHREVARLYMECKIRAEHEAQYEKLVDELNEKVKSLVGEVARLHKLTEDYQDTIRALESRVRDK